MSTSGISVEEVKDRMTRGEKIMFVDTRPRSDANQKEEQLPRAIHVPVDEADKHIRDINRDHLVVTYDRGPDDDASHRVAELLDQHGFAEVHPLIGGIHSWREKGMPLEQR